MLMISATTALGQYVIVTMRADSSSVSVGASTTLHVYAQVVPAQRSTSERIFSWYVDFINDAPAVAQADYTQLLKPTSDKNPQTSSFGTTEGANRRGIHDTFINDSPTSKSGTGVNTPVELFSVPIQAIDVGQARFHVAIGTTASGLAADFIVAPQGGGNPLIGGIYDAANAAVGTVPSAACTPTLLDAYTKLGTGENKITLTFTPCPGRTQVVEYSDKISPASWLALPNGPHNSGTASDTNVVKMRFYRVRIN